MGDKERSEHMYHGPMNTQNRRKKLKTIAFERMIKLFYDDDFYISQAMLLSLVTGDCCINAFASQQKHLQGNKVTTSSPLFFSTPCASINQQRIFLLIFLCASFGHKSRHAAQCNDLNWKLSLPKEESECEGGGGV